MVAMVDHHHEKERQYFPFDLKLAAKNHVKFLQNLHTMGVTIQAVTPNMLHRYLQLWLPLVATTSSDAIMIPPPDIAWLWHCHRLAPARYQEHVQREFEGKILSANPPFQFQRPNDKSHKEDAAAWATQEAWENAYPNVPFFLDPKIDGSAFSKTCPFETLDGFDLVASCGCQANFLWQISGPRFLDDDFLQQGIEKYYKFLLLGSQLKDDGTKRLPLVPTYQIDLMWHTHILQSCTGYRDDCIRIRGARFHHDDSLNDRTVGATLDLAFRRTCDLWEETYQEPYPVKGGMYRGEPPSVYFDVDIWTLQLGQDGGDHVLAAMMDKVIPIGGSSSSGSTVPLWEFEENDGSWTAFRQDHQAEIERTYEAFTQSSQNTTVEIRAGSWRYQVDLRNMTQTNLDHPGRKQRQIRRIDVGAWQFQADNGSWDHFDNHNSSVVEQAYQNMIEAPNSSSSPTLQIQTNNWNYEVNVATMTQTNVSHAARTQRRIRRQVGGGADPIAYATPVNVNSHTTGGTVPTWEFLGDSGWTAYMPFHQKALEDSHRQNSAHAKLKIDGTLYMVDLVNMTQTNMAHQNNRTRTVRRQMGPPVPMEAVAPWKPPYSGTTFHPAAPKSRVRGVNANLKRDNYLFGMGTLGAGYYALDTKDAHKILLLRLAKRTRHAESQVNMFECSNCLCCGCKPSAAQLRAKDTLQLQWEELAYMKAVTAARLNHGTGPNYTPDMATIQRYLDRPIYHKNHSRSADTAGYAAGGCGGYYYYSTDYCAGGGGCGGGDGGGGAGCGGGACGGGGCGGGGCGGGG